MILFNLKSIRSKIKNLEDRLSHDINIDARGEFLIQRFDFGGGSDGKVEQASNYSQEEMDMFNKAASYINKGLSSGASSYSGQTLADTPQEFNDAISQFRNFSSMFGGQQNDALSRILNGESAFNYNPAETIRMWDETVATPAMSVWDREVAPTLREGMAGGFFSTRTPQMIGREKTKFYNESILPSLFTAQQNDKALGAQMQDSALSRMFSGIGLTSDLQNNQLTANMSIADAIQNKSQAKLTDTYNKWASQQSENNPFLQLALKYRTGAQPMYENIGFQGQQTDWLGALTSLGGSAMMAGGMAGGFGNLFAPAK